MKRFNDYGVSLTTLWLHLWFMKLFAVFDSKSGAETIKTNINSVFKRTLSKIELICKNYISTHRNLIIQTYLNTNQTNATSETLDISENKNISIVQKKKKAQETAEAAQKKASKIAQSKNNCAELLSYEKEIIEYINAIIQNANSNVYGYMKKIAKKNPQLIVNVDNPFDNYQFSIADYNLRIKEDFQDVQT